MFLDEQLRMKGAFEFWNFSGGGGGDDSSGKTNPSTWFFYLHNETWEKFSRWYKLKNNYFTVITKTR